MQLRAIPNVSVAGRPGRGRRPAPAAPQARSATPQARSATAPVASRGEIRYIAGEPQHNGRYTMLQELQAPIEELKNDILDTWRRL